MTEIKEVDNFKNLGRILTRSGYCTKAMKISIVMAKDAYRITSFFTNKLNNDYLENDDLIKVGMRP